MSTLTAQQTADRLGVKLATVYAYVSRGVLTRALGSELHASVFRADEVEQLARRGRPRRASRPFVFEVEIETRLTEVRDGSVRYRGRDNGALARTHTFEQVAGLMWNGVLPASSPTWIATAAADARAAHGDLPDRLRVALVQTAMADPLRADLRPEAVASCGASLIAALVDALPELGDGRSPRLALPGVPDVSLLRDTIAGRLWTRLTSTRPRPEAVGVLNAALVLLVDHDLASSTFAARIAASTRADPYAVVMAGLGVVAGPLHGGASRAAWSMFHAAAGPAGVGGALADVLRAHGHYPGFGHFLHTTGDPRATALLALLRDAFGATRGMATVEAVLRTAQQRSTIHPNVDAALGALAWMTGMPADAGEAIFTIARTVGWLAHAREEYEQTALRFRPRARYLPPD